MLRSMADAGELPRVEQLLTFGQSAAGLSSEVREEFFVQLLEMSEEQRRSPLALLLLQWAENDPGAAVLWCREHLKGSEQDALEDELLKTWAHRDAFGCIDWWVANTSNQVRHSAVMIDRMLRADVVAYAYLMDRPEMHFISVRGGIQPSDMPSPDRLPELAAAVVGNVGYRTDAVRRNQPGKSGWNELFEQVAVAWHAHSPRDCEAWLGEFSEEAQAAAWVRIRNPER